MVFVQPLLLIIIIKYGESTHVVRHVTDAVTAVYLGLAGHQDPDGVGGDAGDAVGRYQHDGVTEDDPGTQQLQPGRDHHHLHQPGEGLGGGR